MEGGRRPMLTGTMSIRERDASKLRELLKVRDEEDEKSDGDTHTVGSVAGRGGDKAPPAGVPSRTLLDIIREEESIKYAQGGQKINWKSFKDRLRMRRTSSAWTDYGPGVSVSVSDDFMHAIPTAPPHAPVTPAGAPSPVASSSGGGGASALEAPEGDGPRPVRVSLMTLLEQTDRQSVPLGGASDDGEKDGGTEEEEEEEEEEEGSNGGVEYACCVCMVRHKGAAFIPCGHTFCRLCSRELWVSRGNCPLCNGYILEILDIF